MNTQTARAVLPTRVISPVELISLLKINYQPVADVSDFVVQSLHKLNLIELLEPTATPSEATCAVQGSLLKISERGQFYIEHLLSIQLPVEVKTFKIPETP